MPADAPAVPPATAAPARVLRARPLANPAYHELALDAAHVTRAAQPGQFVHVREAIGGGTILRRPFSIAGCDGDVLTLLFKDVGKLSHRMAGLGPGDALDVLGPLGKGYDLTFAPCDRAYLVGGGYGVAPLLLLAKTLHARGLAKVVSLYEGARSAAHLLWRERLGRERWLEARVATDDGSEGVKGTVVDLLAGELARAAGAIRLFACGPMPMLAAIAARWPELPLQAAVENQMGCGLGVCVGCVLPVKGAAGYDRYVRICCDGPVFDGRVIDWAACPRN